MSLSLLTHSLPPLCFCSLSASPTSTHPLFSVFFHPFLPPSLPCTQTHSFTLSCADAHSLSLPPSHSLLHSLRHSFLFITFHFSFSLSFFFLLFFSVCQFLSSSLVQSLLFIVYALRFPPLHAGQDVDGPALVRGVPHAGRPPAPVHLRPALFTAAAPAAAHRDRRQGGGERALLFGLLSSVWELTRSRREAFSDGRPGLS